MSLVEGGEFLTRWVKRKERVRMHQVLRTEDNSAGGGIRTRKGLLPGDFKSPAFTVSPPRQFNAQSKLVGLLPGRQFFAHTSCSMMGCPRTVPVGTEMRNEVPPIFLPRLHDR